MKKILIILSLLILCCACDKTSKDKKLDINDSDDFKYNDISYSNYSEYICFHFYDNHKYSLYDCDSEPTDLPFDSEFECKAYYFEDESKMKFKCKHSRSSTIDIIEWTKNKFIFEYNGKEYSLVAQK